MKPYKIKSLPHLLIWKLSNNAQLSEETTFSRSRCSGAPDARIINYTKDKTNNIFFARTNPWSLL